MENFTPISALIGGMFIGLAAALSLWANGRIAGISGIISGVLVPKVGDTVWRVLFIIGLFSGSLIYALVQDQGLSLELQAGPGMTVAAGLLVGFGTRLGSGCTSGHGICGLARFSKRSVVATFLFMLTAIITVYLLRHVLELTT